MIKVQRLLQSSFFICPLLTRWTIQETELPVRLASVSYNLGWFLWLPLGTQVTSSHRLKDFSIIISTEGSDRGLPFSTGQKIQVNLLRQGFCVQWECVHSPFAPVSIDSQYTQDFLASPQLGSAVNVNIDPDEHAKFCCTSQCLFSLLHLVCHDIEAWIRIWISDRLYNYKS